MKAHIHVLFRAAAAIAMIVVRPAWARAQDAAAPIQPTRPAPTSAPTLPGTVPPPPPEPPAPAAAVAAPVAPAAPSAVQYSVPQPPMVPPAPQAQGQWVFTSQYGWIWTPYAQNYTYVDGGGELALTYAYYPEYGWRWLPSPWVLGFGPSPYWGAFGYNHFAWHAHPWFQVGIYRPVVWASWGRPYGYSYAVRPGVPMGPRPVPGYVHPTYGRAAFEHGGVGHGGFGHGGFGHGGRR